MTDNEYRLLPGIRRSDLWKMAQTPAHFKYHMEHEEPETPALVFGSALHERILTPETFNDHYVVMPEIDRRTKDGRAQYEAFLQYEAKGRTVITPADFELMRNMTAVLVQNKFALDLLYSDDSYDHERAFMWTDTQTGEPCKIKVDSLATYQGKPYIVDYKTTASCVDGAFERSVRKFGYKLQVGMYTEGLWYNEQEEFGFIFVAQEKTPPYAVRCYIASEDFIMEGTDKFHELMGAYKWCKDNNAWYGYEGASRTMTELFGEVD